MRKTKIEIRANIITCADAYKTAQLAINNWYDMTTNMTDSNGKAEIDLTNVKLAEFDILTKKLLVDSVCKTCYKQVIDNFTRCSNNNLIILLIMNIRVESAIYIKKFLSISYCLVNKLNCHDISNINYISNDVVSL